MDVHLYEQERIEEGEAAGELARLKPEEISVERPFRLHHGFLTRNLYTGYKIAA